MHAPACHILVATAYDIYSWISSWLVVLVVVVVVISRRNNDDDFDDLYDDEDDKSYASIPPSQSYSAPAAQVSPEMAEAMEKFNFWTQEEIQGYFDQGWSIQQLEEWLESQ